VKFPAGKSTVKSYFTSCSFAQQLLVFKYQRMNIYVSSLSFTATDEDLRKLFAEHGRVSSAKVIMDKFTSRSKGFGFVEMPDQAEAEKAMKELNGAHFDGRTINVNEARPREERSERRPYNNNNRY
jgi:RNA recognition motif-containing protein